MAGKQVVALILLLVAVGSASAYSYRPRGEQCEREVEEQMPMKSCMMWAQSKMRRDGDAFLRSARGRRYGEEHLDECCEELRQVSSECRCEAVKEMMMEMPQGKLEMQRMMCSLPTKCRMSPCSCPRFFD